MKYLLDIVQGVDLRICHVLGRFAGNWFIDRFVYFQESQQILKGGLILAAYWWLWFRGGSDREERRKSIIAIMSATVLAIVVTRILAAVLPFRLRPIYVPSLAQHWSIPIDPAFAQWNSFPSDTATYFCALAFGLLVLSPRFRVPIVLYTAGWILFPRVHLGYHYASDVVAGGVIGSAVVWAVLRAGWVQSAIAPRVVAFADAKPHVFYASAFLISYEMAMVFWDIRMLELKLTHATRMLLHHASRAPSATTAADSLAAFSALLLVIAAAIAVLAARNRAHGHQHVMRNRR